MIEKIKKVFDLGIHPIGSHYLQQCKQYLLEKKPLTPLSSQQIRNIRTHILSSKIFPSFSPEVPSRTALDSARTITLGTLPVFSHTVSTSFPHFWHYDPVSKQYGNRTSYYTNIVITPNHAENLAFDIRIPWELPRFHFAYILGIAYKQTSDESYVKTFIALLTSWLQENPYRYGIHWMNPMEVAIRAINIVGTLEKMKTSTLLTEDTWTAIITLLHQSVRFIETNWELYFKRNNHYLANLLGHYVICGIFQVIPSFEKKLQKCHRWLEQEIRNQTLSDGTSYEGSTSYHRLVTEMVDLYIRYAHLYALPLNQNIKRLFRRMSSFSEHCTVSPNYFISIGDNDSGHILPYTFTVQPNHQQNTVKHYPDFGLSIIKKYGWHATFRHPAYHNRQPSGHFHEDELSITLAYHGIPVLIDPGSFIYTGSTWWRNHFRSYHAHNTCYTTSRVTSNMFSLSKEPIRTYPTITQNNNNISIKDSWNGITRKIIGTNEAFAIIDTVQNLQPMQWALVFHPNITLEKNSPHQWNISDQRNTLLTLKTSIPLQLSTGWYAPDYGSKKPCPLLYVECYETALVAEEVSCTFA